MTTEHIGYKIKVAQQTLRNNIDKELLSIALTTPQYAALCGIEELPGLSNVELARYCFVTPQTVNEITKFLKRKSLITTGPHKNNKKKVAIQLTKEGRTILQVAHQVVKNIEKTMLSALTFDDQKRFLSYLEKCIESLDTKQV